MSRNEQYRYVNLLEPPGYVRLFQKHPPVGFSCKFDSLGQPVFITNFDLLTTLEQKALRFFRKLPFFEYWSRIFKLRTCFLGSTNTEYAPLAGGMTANDLMRNIMAEHSWEQPLFVIKDLPDASPFLTEEENALAAALSAEAAKLRLIEVQGQALAYVPVNFANIDDYMSGLSAARRKDLRRKFKKRELLEIEILRLGAQSFSAPELCNKLYAMYIAVYEQSEIHFDILSREYMTSLLQADDIEGIVVMYRRKSEDGLNGLVGYNICLTHNGRLIDKYIGLKYPEARELNLYFISWLVNLEYALENGLKFYIVGWTDPEVKKSLGASFTFTRHLVWVQNPFLRRFLYPFRRLFESDRQTIESMQ